jgi:NDP-sugar pyrophosphorylase family protein
MKKIILLSGHSQRFLDEGYNIKPLIKIGNKTVLELVVETIHSSDEENYSNYIFVVKKEDIMKYNVHVFISSHFPECTIVPIESNKEGPVYSLKNAYEYILNDEEVLVSYCDLYIKWNFQEFIDYINSVKCDGLLVSHNNWHPHRIHNKSFAYMLTDRYNNVYKIMEKDYFIDPLKEPASSGIYYFKSGAVLKKYCDMLLKRGIKTNNEFYLTLPYNLMIEDGLVVKHYVHRYYFCFGTPRDVELIKGCYYLLKHLGQQQFYNSDVIQCMSYFENIINDV